MEKDEVSEFVFILHCIKRFLDLFKFFMGREIESYLRVANKFIAGESLVLLTCIFQQRSKPAFSVKHSSNGYFQNLLLTRTLIFDFRNLMKESLNTTNDFPRNVPTSIN